MKEGNATKFRVERVEIDNNMSRVTGSTARSIVKIFGQGPKSFEKIELTLGSDKIGPLIPGDSLTVRVEVASC